MIGYTSPRVPIRCWNLKKYPDSKSSMTYRDIKSPIYLTGEASEHEEWRLRCCSEGCLEKLLNPKHIPIEYFDDDFVMLEKNNCQVIQSALFIPSWRPLNPLKGSRFHHPKKVTNWITRWRITKKKHHNSKLPTSKTNTSSVKLTVRTCQDSRGPKRKLVFQPAHFQVLPVSFQGDYFFNSLFPWFAFSFISHTINVWYMVYVTVHFTIHFTIKRPTNKPHIQEVGFSIAWIAKAQFIAWNCGPEPWLHNGRNSRHLLMATRNPGSRSRVDMVNICKYPIIYKELHACWVGG